MRYRLSRTARAEHRLSSHAEPVKHDAGVADVPLSGDRQKNVGVVHAAGLPDKRPIRIWTRRGKSWIRSPCPGRHCPDRTFGTSAYGSSCSASDRTICPPSSTVQTDNRSGLAATFSTVTRVIRIASFSGIIPQTLSRSPRPSDDQYPGFAAHRQPPVRRHAGTANSKAKTHDAVPPSTNGDAHPQRV